MFKYAETTALILFWCGLDSIALAIVSYFFVSRERGVRTPALSRSAWRAHLVVPALVAGPVALVVAFRLTGINLMFPLRLFADFWALVSAAFVPGVVLVIASGMVATIRHSIHGEYFEWRGRPFATAALAFGSSPRRALFRLVVAKTLARAWSQCLPWLFGELIVVESVFNAPGLGLDAWQMARLRDFMGLFVSIAWLTGLYAVALAGTALLNGWLGRRLESYA